MYRLLLYFPFARARVCGLGGRWLGSRGRRTLRTSSLRITRLLRWTAFYEVGMRGMEARVNLRTWFQSDVFEVHWTREVDRLRRLMLRLVTSVSTLVHLYSREYLRKDPHLPRFYSYLSLFTFRMVVLVTRRDLIQLFFGWEGVGVASFLLIHFWTRRRRRNSGANKAMIYNRVGDLRLALGVFSAFHFRGRVDFASLRRMSHFSKEGILFVGNWEVPRLSRIRILLLLGAMGKSAQMGLHPWLPDAMEGPTPVSALIHAATMVTAGVYLLARTHPIRTERSQTRVMVVGRMTSLFAVSVGSGQTDLKRMIAYSTCSQLGFMVFACGAGQYSRAMFHLFTHGFYKRLLFLSRGSVIHAMSDEQDLRRMGGRAKTIPLTTMAILIGSFALRGFPFRAGFYSKDLILETGEGVSTVLRAPLALSTSLAAYGTAYYSTSIVLARFLGEPKAPRSTVATRHEPGFAMTTPLRILTVARIFAGWFREDLLVGIGTPFWGASLSPNRLSERILTMEFHSWKVLPLTLSVRAVILRSFSSSVSQSILSLSSSSPRTRKARRRRQNFLSRRWGFDRLFHQSVRSNTFSYGWETTYRALDQGVLEFLTPFRSSQRTSYASTRLQKKESLYGMYVFWMFRRRVFLLFLSLRLSL